MTPKNLGSYGGPKVDSLPVEDPTSQLASAEYNALATDCAELTRTCPRAIVTWFAGSSGPWSPSVNMSLWGSTFAPTITHPATGIWLLTWPTTAGEEDGESEALNFQACHVQTLFPMTTFGLPFVNAIGPNYVQVYTITTSSTLTDLGATVTAWVY